MSLDSKQKKALLAVGITICLLVAGDKIYKFYQSLQPPYQVGECFSVDSQIGTINFKVIENNKSEKTTDAVGTVNGPFGMMGVKIQIPVRVSFDDLRDATVKATKCEE